MYAGYLYIHCCFPTLPLALQLNSPAHAFFFFFFFFSSSFLSANFASALFYLPTLSTFYLLDNIIYVHCVPFNMNPQEVDEHFTPAVRKHIETAINIPGSHLSMDNFDPNLPAPDPDQAASDPESMSVLVVHPDWNEARDTAEWVDSNLQTLLFSQDPMHRMSEMENGIPNANTTHWIPPQQPMLITGPFCSMAPEIMWMIIPHLDLKTVSNLSRTCRYLRSVVSQEPTVRFIFTVMPSIPKILATTNLLGLHSLYDLVRETGHSQCRLCGDNASSVFLPTCERMCPNCLISDRRYALIPVEAIESAFNFSLSDLKKLPLIRAPTPAHAHFLNLDSPWPLPPVRFLTPLKCALKRAMVVYKSPKELVAAARWAVPTAFGNLESHEVTRQDLFMHIINECLANDPHAFQPGSQSLHPDFGIDSYLGYASAKYPYVSPEGVISPQFGVCRGCQDILSLPWVLTQDLRDYVNMPAEVTLETVDRFVCREARVLRTWEELRDQHLPVCLGAQFLMYQYFEVREGAPE